MHGGRQTDILVMDFSEAFDMVCHRLLITKLITYGLNGKNIARVRVFLTNRKQRVWLNVVASEDVYVLSGVPHAQCSVLGSYLFSLYINDFPESLIFSVRPFADDTIAYLNIPSWTHVF